MHLRYKNGYGSINPQDRRIWRTYPHRAETRRAVEIATYYRDSPTRPKGLSLVLSDRSNAFIVVTSDHGKLTT
jgi:hypothetical protein